MQASQRNMARWALAGGVLLATVAGGGMLALATINNAESWGTLPYQGRLENNGVLVNGAVDFCFQLFADDVSASALWAEQQAGVAVAAGEFSVRLGSVTALNAAVEGAASLFLEVGVTAAGSGGGCPGGGYTTLSGRQRLGASGYALSAKQGVPGQDFPISNNLIVGGSVGVGVPAPAVRLEVAGNIKAQDGFGYVPLGTIMAWNKNATAAPLTLAPGWAVCDGSNVAVDVGGPLDPDGNGQYATPNLNGTTQRFLRGSTASGAVGGAETHVHSFGQTGADMAPDSSHFTDGSFTNPANHLPPYFEVVWIMRVR